MIRTIVFDFGNVIGFFDHRLAAERLARLCRLPPEELCAFLYGGELEDAYEAGRITSAEFLRRLRARGGFTCGDDELAAAYCDMFWPNRDVIALLPALKPHYRLLLGSNTTDLHARWYRRQFADALAVFDGVVLSYEIGVRKPAAGFFEHCRRLAGCAAAECVFIDDLPPNVAGARACGWHGIVYTGLDDLRRRFAELGIETGPPANGGVSSRGFTPPARQGD